jgi:hypothetical protein
LAGKVNLQEQFARFDDYWSPKIVASVNDYDVKLVKVRGEFVWHQHDETDEVFLVTAGQLRIHLQDHDRQHRRRPAGGHGWRTARLSACAATSGRHRAAALA